MKCVENEVLLRQLKWRYATKKFDPARKISAEDWLTLEQSLVLSPSSYGLQPWHFIVVTSQKVKDQMMAAAWGQKQVSDASHVIVFTVNKKLDTAHADRLIAATSEARKTPVEKLEGFRKMLHGTISSQDEAALEAWNARQVYIALGQLLTSAALLGIDACPMEGMEPAKIDQILGLTEKGYGTVVIVPLGYRAPDDHSATAAKVRFKAEELITHVD